MVIIFISGEKQGTFSLDLFDSMQHEADRMRLSISKFVYLHILKKPRTSRESVVYVSRALWLLVSMCPMR